MSACTEILNLNNGKKFKLSSLEKIQKIYPDSSLDKRKCVFGTAEQKAGKVVCEDTTAGKKRVFDKEGGKCVVPTAKMCEDKKIIKEGDAYILVTKSSKGKAVDCGEFRGLSAKAKKTASPAKKTIASPAKKTTTSSTKKKVECTKDQIINPDSGKCVSKTGAIGKKILGGGTAKKTAPTPKKKSTKEPITKCSDAPSGKKRVLNRETGNCTVPTAKMCEDKKIIKEGDLYILVTKSSKGKTVDCAEFRGVGSTKAEPKAKTKECPEDKIRNPESGKCVKKTGSIGKKLSAEPKVKAEPKAKAEAKVEPKAKKPVKCDKDYILNPESGKCVLKSGKIGKKLVEEQKAAKKAVKVVASCVDAPAECQKEGKVCKEETGKCVKVTREQLKNGKFVKKGSDFFLSKIGKSLASTPKEAEELMSKPSDSEEIPVEESSSEESTQELPLLLEEDEDLSQELPELPTVDDEEESFIETELPTIPITKTEKPVKCRKDEVFNLKTSKCNKLDSWTEARLKREGLLMKSIDGVRYVGTKDQVDGLSTSSCPASKVLDVDADVCITPEKASKKVEKGSTVGEKQDGTRVVGTKSNVKAAGALPIPVRNPTKMGVSEIVEESDSEGSEEASYISTGGEDESVSGDIDVMNLQQSREKLMQKIKECMNK